MRLCKIKLSGCEQPYRPHLTPTQFQRTSFMDDRPSRVGRYAAWALIAAGALVCLGWELRIGVLKGQSFGTFVSPNAALAFLLIGASCLFQLSSRSALVRLGQAIGILIALFSAATILEYLLRVDLRIDHLFLSNRLSDWTLPTPPGRAALPTMLALLFSGIGLVTIRIHQAGRAADWCAGVVAIVAYLGFVGYGYKLPKLYGGLMALPTAVLLGVAAVALATLRSGSVVTSKGAGGVVFRRVITPLLVLMPLLGFIKIWAQQKFSITLEMGTALFVVVVVFLFAGITAHTAGVINALDAKRKRAEESLIRAEKLAAAGRLSATIAHEVNNPLACVMNLLFLARTADSAAKTGEYICVAEDELRRAAEIAKRTLGFYRDDSQPLDVDLAALAREVLELFQGKASALEIRMETDLQPTPNVRARPGEIRQIIGNLLGNAIDAVQAEKQPEITLAVRERGGVAQLLVRDNGHGVPEAQQHRIFEPFFTTKKDVGTGLGLYMSRQLAEKNGGALRFESSTRSDRRGTTLCLTLPLARPILEAVPAGERARAKKHGEEQ